MAWDFEGAETRSGDQRHRLVTSSCSSRYCGRSEAGCDSIRVEVLLERWSRRAVLIRPSQEIDDDFPGSRNLPQTRDRPPVTRIVQREVDQLERTIQRRLRDCGISAGPANGPTDFAADVAQLLGDRELPPSSRGEVAMLGVGHRRTSRPPTFPGTG